MWLAAVLLHYPLAFALYDLCWKFPNSRENKLLLCFRLATALQPGKVLGDCPWVNCQLIFVNLGDLTDLGLASKLWEPFQDEISARSKDLILVLCPELITCACDGSF